MVATTLTKDSQTMVQYISTTKDLIDLIIIVSDKLSERDQMLYVIGRLDSIYTSLITSITQKKHILNFDAYPGNYKELTLLLLINLSFMPTMPKLDEISTHLNNLEHHHKHHYLVTIHHLTSYLSFNHQTSIQKYFSLYNVQCQTYKKYAHIAAKCRF